VNVTIQATWPSTWSQSTRLYQFYPPFIDGSTVRWCCHYFLWYIMLIVTNFFNNLGKVWQHYEVQHRDQFYGRHWMMWLEDNCSMAINEWSATQGPVDVTWRQLFHDYQWMKCYPGTSQMAITEWCDLKTIVPWLSMNEVLPRDQFYGHYWMMWLEDNCSMAINEWSATQRPAQCPLLNVVTWRQLFHGY
jgi:hypothetical protein